MTEILPFLKDQIVFTPDATHAMSVAFDEVCRTLFVPDNAKAVREAIADKVIEHARCGEHDPDRLRDAVLRQIGVAGRKSAGAYLGRPQSPRSRLASQKVREIG